MQEFAEVVIDYRSPANKHKKKLFGSLMMISFQHLQNSTEYILSVLHWTSSWMWQTSHSEDWERTSTHFSCWDQDFLCSSAEFSQVGRGFESYNFCFVGSYALKFLYFNSTLKHFMPELISNHFVNLKLKFWLWNVKNN
jgi:hypothetical protein